MRVPKETKKSVRKYVGRAYRYARRYPSDANYGALTKWSIGREGRVKFFCMLARQSIKDRAISDIIVYHEKHDLSFVIAQQKIAKYTLSRLHGNRGLAASFLESYWKNIDGQFHEVNKVVLKFVKNNRGLKTADAKHHASIMLKHRIIWGLHILENIIKGAMQLVSED